MCGIHVVYWWICGSDRLSRRAKKLILDRANIVLVSAASAVFRRFKWTKVLHTGKASKVVIRRAQLGGIFYGQRG